MSAYQTPTSDQIAAMNSLIDALNTAITDLSAKVALQTPQGTNVFNQVWTFDSLATAAVGSYDAAKQVQGDVNQWKAQIDDLAGRQQAQVLEGTESLEGWFGTAHAVFDSIKSTGADMVNWTWDGIASKTYDKTIAEAKSVVTTGALIGAPIVILGIALYLVLVFGARR